MTIKARVLGGRLTVDEPTNLPEGTEVQLLPSTLVIGSTRQTGRRCTKRSRNQKSM
jgi:hypothetical protein